MKTLILTPVYGELHPKFKTSLIKTTREIPSIAYDDLRGCSHVERARALLLGRFLFLSKADTLLCIDGDISFSVEDVRAVLDPIERGELDVVCGVYPQKTPKQKPNCDFFASEIDEARGFIGETRGNYLRLKSAGAGFIAFSRRSLEKACLLVTERFTAEKNEIPLLFRSGVDEQKAWFSEDTGACLTLARAGFHTWAARDAKLTHWQGDTAYGGRAIDFDRFAKLRAFGNSIAETPVERAELQRRLDAIQR